MEDVLHWWPIIAFVLGLFVAGVGIAIGLTMWIMGRLAEQDARRIELKEALLLEIRDTRHRLDGSMRQLYMGLDEKVDDLAIRMAKVETILSGQGWYHPGS